MSVPLKPARPPVRRCLFGKPSTDSKDFLTEALEAEMKKKVEEWGFDFVAGRPLENSDVEYEALEVKEVPSFYHTRHYKAPARPAVVDPNVPSTSAPRTPVRLTRAAKRKLEHEVPETDVVPQKQASIMNFVKVMKRRSLKLGINTDETNATPSKEKPDVDVESSPFRYVSAEAERRAEFPAASPATSPRKSPRKRVFNITPMKSPKKTPQKRANAVGKLRPRSLAGRLTRSLLRADKPPGTQ